MSDLNYNDIKTEKMSYNNQKSVEKPRKTTKFHELTRGLSPKRKSTKMLLLDVESRKRKQSIYSKKPKVDFDKERKQKLLMKGTFSKDSNHLDKNMEDSQIFPPSPDRAIDKISDRNRFLKLRKILINAKNTRNDSVHDLGLQYAKAFKNKENMNFSFVSNTFKALGGFGKKEKNGEENQKEVSRAMKMIDAPIINESLKFDDYKESYARIHV